MSLRSRDFDCARCKFGRHCDESNPAPYNKFVLRGTLELESRTCFLPMVTPQSNFLLRMYVHYKNGWLPYDGGLLEQPSYYLQAMEIIAGVIEAHNGRVKDNSQRSRPD